jgi:cytochrome P450
MFSEKHQGVAVASYIPTFDDQKGFEYITACIKEAIRIYPPIIVLPSRVTSRRTQLGGVEVPEGTIVKVNIFEIHRSSKVWGPDSEVFLPERFLPEQHPLARDMEGLGLGSGLTPTRNPHPYAFIPFGANQRICIGQQFSLIEQRVLLGALLLRYSFSLPAGVEELTINTRALLSPKDLFIEFSRIL